MRANVAGRWTWAFGLLVVGVVTGGAARAAPAREAPRLQVELHASAECASVTQFTERLRARASQASPKARLIVRLTARGAGVHAELAVLRAEGRIERALDAASCAEALDALALVAALILDPTPAPAASARAETREQSPAREPRAPASAARASAPAPGPTPGTAVQAPPSAPARPEAALAPAVAPAPVASQADAAAPPEPARPASEPEAIPQVESTRRAPPETTPTRAADSPPRALALDLLAGALLLSGVAPTLRPGAAIGVALGARRARRVLFGELDARLAWPQREESSEGVASFRFGAAGLKLCARGLWANGQLGLSGCALAELGALAARGSETDQPQDSRELWAALGPALRLSWHSRRRVWLRLGGELAVPLARQRYMLAEQTVFSVPSGTFRGEFAVGVTLL